MADQAEKYVEQWKRNRRFAKTIDGVYRDWQVTVVFYTALHAVNVALARLGVTVANHTERNQEVRDNAALAAIRKPYLNLLRIANITRYDCEPDLWLPQQYQTVNDLAEDLLRPIENGVGAIVGKAIHWEPLDLKT